MDKDVWLSALIRPLLIKLMEARYIILIPFVTVNRQTQQPSFTYIFLPSLTFLSIKVSGLLYLIKHWQQKQICLMSTLSAAVSQLSHSGSWSLKRSLTRAWSGEPAADYRGVKYSVNQMRLHSVECHRDQKGNDKSLMQESILQCTCHRGFCGLRPFFLLSGIISIHPSSTTFPSGIIIVWKFFFSWISEIPDTTLAELCVSRSISDCSNQTAVQSTNECTNESLAC